MPSQRQQRAPRNRRLVSYSTPAIVPSPVPELVTKTAHTLTLHFRQYGLPAVSPGAVIPVQLNGIPSVVRLLDDSLPTAALLLAGSQQIRLTYGGATIGDEEAFRTSPFDPSIRTNTGGFIACSTIAPTGGPSNLWNFTVALIDPNTVTLGYGSPGVPVVFDPLKFRHDQTSTYPSSLTATSASSLTAVYAATISSGDTIRYDGVDMLLAPVNALSFDHTPRAVP